MKYLLLVLFIALATLPLAAQQPSERFVEVIGQASRLVPADAYFFSITVNPGAACQIPKQGRNWEKEIKDCKEEQGKLVASREAMLAAILGSFSGKIQEVQREASGSYWEGMPDVHYFTCRNYMDYSGLLTRIREVEGHPFKVELNYAQTLNPQEIMAGLDVECLKNAREQAQAMASVLGMVVGLPLQIFDNESTEPSGSLMEKSLLDEMTKRTRGSRTQYSSTSPNDKGEVFFEARARVRFEMKPQ